MDGRDEAARWINLALKLLANRDLVGTKTFAIRAKEADPTMGYAEEILAVVDTLMAGQQQINGRYDWYGVLRVERMCGDAEVIAGEYRRLALLLNPQRNGLPFAEEAFGLVNEAWSVLSNPLRKSLYDNELSWLDSSGSGSVSSGRVPVQQHQFLPMLSQSQSQQTQIMTPVRVQPQQYQHAQPQFQPQVQFQPQPGQRVQSTPVPQPQVQFQPQPGQRIQAQPVPQPQVQFQHLPQQKQHQQVQQRQPQQRQQEPIPVQVDPHPPMWKTPVRNTEEEEVEAEVDVEEVATDPVEEDEDEVSTFWTACPYCYHLFEYLKKYEDCSLRCQNKNCRRAFHASAIAPPPESKSDKKASFCSWGFFPIGAPPVYLNSGKNESGKRGWLPFSPMFTCPTEPGKGVAPVAPNGWNKARAKPKAVIVDDDDYVLMELSDSTGGSDNDFEWGSNSTRRKKRGRPPKVKTPVRKSGRRGVAEKLKNGASEAGDHVVENNGNALDDFANEETGDASAAKVTSSKSGLNGNMNLSKVSGKNPKDLGKLDLNVEFNNEVEETISTKNCTIGAETSTGAGTSTGVGTSARAVASAGAGTSNGAEENIEAEGVGFFEGLDEFLNSLPILSAVGDDKVKAA